ncbi:hypothetical protein J5N97_006750 [Dioscorea zingiberensis]|uniref:Neprosin PEP catalytic domain-containing protein n=1 Tax=Dioscorea zingiberensis TaxID=325984 RepID=A0A9D5DBE1_9LILI|nr:hypothetical protein J5N97_006750 [Dioscorea zingiberensis]
MEHHKWYDFQFILILLLLSNALVGSTSMRPKEKEKRSNWQLNPLSKTSIKTIKITPMLPNGILKNISNSKILSNIGLSIKCPKGTVLIRQPHHGYSQMLETNAQISYRTYEMKQESYVSPEEYGDKASRLYTYWTSDGFQKTGCFNLDCPGFIQLSRTFTPGMKLSIGKGVLKLTVYRDVKTLNWFLLLGEHEIIGYWPKEIFNNLVDSSQVEITGYVYSPLDENSPPMGNGIFPNPDPSKACELKHIKLLNENGDFIVPGSDSTYSLFNDLPDYYGVVTEKRINEFSLSVGGPGGYK